MKARVLIPALVVSLLLAACHNDLPPKSKAADGSVQASTPAAPAVAVPTAAQQTEAPAYSGQQQTSGTHAAAPSNASSLIRVHYGDLFTDNGDGSFTPKASIAFNGIAMSAGSTREYPVPVGTPNTHRQIWLE